jgi:rhamnulokinase
MRDALYLAVDLGAGTGRIALCGVERAEFLLEEVCRFRYPPSQSLGEFRWDIDRIFDEIKAGLLIASERARSLGRPIRSAGIDSWGRDYGLVDAEGQLVDCPIACVDGRTLDVQSVFERVSPEEIFERTGATPHPCNTLFRFYDQAQKGLPATAARLLMIPDLMNLFLTGRAAGEHTKAATTQMLNAATGEWDHHLAKRLGLPSTLLPQLLPSGRTIGVLKQTLADELRIARFRVVATATHDDASAIAGAPLRHGWSFISSAGHSLIGVERSGPLINERVARLGFTNEAGPFGTVRLFKSVKTLGILESCIEEWKDRGLSIDVDRLEHQCASIEKCPAFIAPEASCFNEPRSIIDAISRQLVESGQPVPAEPAALARVVLDSIALSYSSVLRKIEGLTGSTIHGIQMIGPGSEIDYLNQSTANATGLPVVVGPVDSKIVGNAVVQAIACGRFSSLAEARSHVAETLTLKVFKPEQSSVWQDAKQRYAKVEAEFSQASVAASFRSSRRVPAPGISVARVPK